MCFLFLLFAIVASTSIYRYTLLYHLCPIPSIESASSFFPTKRFRIKDIRVEYYANKINGRKLSRLFDYDLKSIYVYCYRVNFLSLDIRYFHRTVKNICIYIYISIRQWHVFGENCISETRISRGSFVNRGELFARRACYRPNFQSMSRINILGGAVDNLSLT